MLRRLKIEVLIFCGLCIVIAGLAGLELSRSFSYGNLVFIGNRLDVGSRMSPDYIAANLAGVDDMVSANLCRSDLLHAASLSVLFNLDQQKPNADFELFQQVLVQADRFFTHAIACLPLNGEYWLRLAQVRRQVAEVPQEQFELLQRSVMLAPAEEQALIGRLWMYTRLSDLTMKTAHPLLETDLDRYMRWSVPRANLPLMRALRQRYEPDVAKIAAAMPAQTRDRWRRSGEDLEKPPKPAKS